MGKEQQAEKTASAKRKPGRYDSRPKLLGACQRVIFSIRKMGRTQFVPISGSKL